jgi:hypothetical protein
MSDIREPEGFAELRRLGDDMPERDETARARARSRLDRAIQRERGASTRTSLQRWGAVAAAIVILSVATTVFLREMTDRRVTEPALRRLAAVASVQRTPSVPAGSFVYTRARVRASDTRINITTGEEEMVIVGYLRETWIAADGSGVILQRPLESGSGEATRFDEGPGTLRFTNLDGLPTEPEALLEAIMKPGFLDEPDDDLEILRGIGGLLRDSYLDPAHREGLFLIVEGMQGVEVDEGYRDHLGRIGIAVSLRDSTRAVTLVFEPRTSRLLAEADTHDDGTFSEATYLETAVVGDAGDRPTEAGS